MSELVDKAVALDKWSLGRLISKFEDQRTEAAAARRDVLAELADRDDHRAALFVGITGTPGSGKSTLIGELATRLVREDDSIAVAVLAVDPTSHVSGGALLGDRTRVRFPPDENRLFFRSQATDLDLGGVGRGSFQVCRLLYYLFDIVFVETVGIGQSEVEIQFVADWIYLVVQPMAGDQIQFMKAGVMEVPNAFILNKCDEREAAARSYHALEASLDLVRPGTGERVHVHRTSAVTGEGLDELVEEIQSVGVRRSMAEKEAYFFQKWVRDELGRRGLALLEKRSAAQWVRDSGSFDDAQVAFEVAYRDSFSGD